MTTTSSSSSSARERILARGSSASSAWPSSTTTDSSFRMTPPGRIKDRMYAGSRGARVGETLHFEMGTGMGDLPHAPSEQLVGEGVRRRRGPGGHAELEEDVADVPVDGLLTQEQL